MKRFGVQSRRRRSFVVGATLAVVGFYKDGRVIPSMLYLFDPVSSYSQEVVWGVDWFVTPNFGVNLAQRFIGDGAAVRVPGVTP